MPPKWTARIVPIGVTANVLTVELVGVPLPSVDVVVVPPPSHAARKHTQHATTALGTNQFRRRSEVLIAPRTRRSRQPALCRRVNRVTEGSLEFGLRVTWTGPELGPKSPVHCVRGEPENAVPHWIPGGLLVTWPAPFTVTVKVKRRLRSGMTMAL